MISKMSAIKCLKNRKNGVDVGRKVVKSQCVDLMCTVGFAIFLKLILLVFLLKFTLNFQINNFVFENVVMNLE